MKTQLSRLSNTLLFSTSILLSHQALALDVEIDPLAYGFQGHSVHFGFGEQNFRFDLGFYGLEVPESFHGNENYEQEFTGYGIKLDYLFGRYDGFFAGLQAGSAKYKYTHTSTNETTTRTQTSLGPRIGYRFMYNKNITITPWIAVEFNLEHDDIDLNNEMFESDTVAVFPTIHLGWKF